MDSVRFGRALGFGARSAVKALAAASDAATTPNPNRVQAAKPTPTASPRPSAAIPPTPAVAAPIAAAAKTAARATIQAREARKGIARGSKRFGESVWGPFAKLSGVLWLEITGSFFGIFALFAGSAVWSHRHDLHPLPANPDGRLHLLVFVVMTLVFAYFCISSFVRAYRR